MPDVVLAFTFWIARHNLISVAKIQPLIVTHVTQNNPTLRKNRLRPFKNFRFFQPSQTEVCYDYKTSLANIFFIFFEKS
jgi:hypothetical protein